jgi:hypothetical protein
MPSSKKMASYFLLKALFCEAGCSDLFKLDKIWLDDKSDKEIATAQYIANYLGI